MANKRISIQVDFQGPSPIISRSNGTTDKRTSLINLKRLFASIDKGTQYRNPNTAKPTVVVVQQSVVQATGTVTPAGVLVADTVTINGQALTATQRRATQTLTVALGNAGDTFVLNGSTFTAVSGAAGPQQYDISSGVNNTIALSIANAVNTSVDTRVKGVIQSQVPAAAVVTLYATTPGTYYNAVTLTSTGAGRLVAGGATFAGGAANTNNTFDPMGTNAQTGAEIARASNASTTAAVQQVVATVSASGVVTWTARAPGVSGNVITLASSNGGRLAVSGATLAGGSAGNATQWSF